MKQKSKQKTSASSVSTETTFSFIIPLVDNLVDEKSINSSFQTLEEEHKKRIELIVVKKEKTNDNIASSLQSTVQNTQVITVNEDQSLSDAFKAGIIESENNFVVCLNPANLTKQISIKGIMAKYPNKDTQSAGILSFKDAPKIKVNSNSIIVLPKNKAKYIASIGVSKEEFTQEVSYYLNQLRETVDNISIPQESPFETMKNKMFSKGKTNFYGFLNWFFKVPLKEIKTKNQYSSFIKDHSIYRFLFVSIIVISGIVLPILSYNTGNSGDEKVQYEHAKKVISYYKTFGEDTVALENKKTGMHLYGASFDILTAAINDIFGIEKEYEARHVFNAIFGWLLFIFIGLIAYRIAGWRAALITLLLVFLSPRLLGHSWNNPKDIPFALGYVMSIYYIIRFIEQMPRPSFRTLAWLSVSIALAISIRIGGLLLIAYFVMFVGLQFLFTSKQYGGLLAKDNLTRFKQLFVIVFLVSVAGYFIGLLLWPYALQNPIKNPLESLKTMTNYSGGIRQIFDGKIIWSNKVPSSYIPTYILYTIPLLVFTGMAILIGTLGRSLRSYKALSIFILFFSFIFPIFYVIYKTSNLYGGMRHVLFAYPTLVVIAGLGYNQLLLMFKNKYFKIGLAVIMIALAFHPAKHIIKNHPYQYIYFNEILGGVENALGEYEIDYYYHSMKEGAEWLLENKILPSKADSTNKLKVGLNGLGAYYFKNYRDKVDPVYIRYYDRGNKDWDYALIANSYLNPYQLKKKKWPPKNTIHTIKVDDVPICAILKRENKDDYTGYSKFAKKDYQNAIIDLEKSLKHDPNNESALLVLTQTYINVNQLNQALVTVEKLLKVYPNYDKALNLKGFIYMRQNKGDEALMIFDKIINKVNYRFINAYYNAGIVFANKSLFDAALNKFADGLVVNQKFNAIYVAIAQVMESYRQKGDMKKAYKILAKKLHDHKYVDFIFYNISESMKQRNMANEAQQLLIYVNSYNK